MALIGNNQLTVGVAGATLAGTSIENTQIPLPTTIFRVETVDANGVNPGDPDYIPTYASQDNIVLNNGGSSLTVPEDYTLAIFGGIEGAGDSTTGFLKVDGASIQVSTMPDRAFRDSDFPLGFNGATFQYVGTDLARAGGQRWPENSASGRVAVDFRNCKVIGQDVSLYAGITDTRNNGWLFHLGAADTGVAFDRTGSLAGGDLQDRFSGASFDGIQFFGAITQQIPADVNFISVAFNDYNKAVAPEINNLRITAPKGPGVVRTVIKDGIMPFGTGIRAQAADGKVIIILADTDAFAPYQDPATYAEGVTNVFISNYPQIVTGGVNSGGGGSFWRGYGWKPALLDVSTSIQIPEGFIDFNLPAGDFVIFPSSINTAIPQIRASNGTGAISHTVTGGDNEGYWVITSNANDVEQRNVTPNIDTAVVFTPATPYFMDYLVLANIMPQHVPTGVTVESFDETQVQQVQYSPDALSGDFTFDTANDDTTGNSNATQAYAALKLAHKDGSVGVFGDAVDTSTNGGAQASFNGNLVFSGSLPTALTNTGNAAVRVGSGFIGGNSNGAIHNRWSASQITLASGTTFGNIAFEATGNLICIGAALTNSVSLNGTIVGLPSTFGGTIEDGSFIVADADAQFNLEGAVIEGTVTLTSNEIGGTDVILDGNFTGTLVAGTGVNNIIIPVLYTVEPNLQAGTNGFYALRNLTTSTTVVDVTITNGVPSSTASFIIDASDTDTFLAFYKLESSITGDQVYRVATQSITGTGLTRDTLVNPLTVPRPFTASATGVKTDGDLGAAVALSYTQDGNALIGAWLNNTASTTRPNAFETMTNIIQASNSQEYFSWMESRALTIDPTDYSSDGATVFNNSVAGLSGLSTTDGIRWNSQNDTIQSQVSQAAGFFSDNVSGVTVQQVLSFDIGNAPLGTVSAALSPLLTDLPTANDLDTLGDELKENQQTTANVFGVPTLAKGINNIILPNQ